MIRNEHYLHMPALFQAALSGEFKTLSSGKRTLADLMIQAFMEGERSVNDSMLKPFDVTFHPEYAPDVTATIEVSNAGTELARVTPKLTLSNGDAPSFSVEMPAAQAEDAPQIIVNVTGDTPVDLLINNTADLAIARRTVAAEAQSFFEFATILQA